MKLTTQAPPTKTIARITVPNGTQIEMVAVKKPFAVMIKPQDATYSAVFKLHSMHETSDLAWATVTAFNLNTDNTVRVGGVR